MAPPSNNRTKTPRSLVPILGVILLLQACFYLGLQTAAWSGGIVRIPALPEDPAARLVRWRSMGYDAALDPDLGRALPEMTLHRVDGGELSLTRFSGRNTLVIFLAEYG